MPHAPFRPSRARTLSDPAQAAPGSRGPARVASAGRGRRGALRAGALVASVAALLSAGSLGLAQAATGPATGAAPAGRPEPKGEQRITAAVLDLDAPGRKPTLYGADTAFDTASIVKVDILATLLLQAQDHDRELSARERTQAKAMIEHSDNASANALWRAIGLAPGLKAANERLGLTSTQGGPGAKWGLTRTTASDQIRLLRAVFDTDGSARSAAPALDQGSRTYLRTLMAGVADEQSWGVSAAGTSGTALKNGWLQRSTTGLWDVNSVGRITAADGHHYLVAVLSDGSETMQAGVSLVEREAKAALTAATAH